MTWERVYRLVKQIPRGRVATYGQLARLLRLRGGARAVGYAMAACPSGRGIPWHRVVGAGGYLRVPEPYDVLQRRLLVSEGVPVEGLRVDLASHGWALGKARGRGKRGRRKGDSRQIRGASTR
jgi:methylated-DNA-protein-cysteine methyltransferase related protein